MYMHYILGQCIKSHVNSVNEDHLADVAENTYVMALDGDVDFKPESVSNNTEQSIAFCGTKLNLPW